MRFIQFIYLLTLFALSNCNVPNDLEGTLTPKEKEEVASAKNYFDLLRQGKLDQIEKDADVSIKTSDFHNTLEKMVTFMPPQEPTSVKVVDFKPSITWIAGEKIVMTHITFEYQFSDKWFLGLIDIRKKNEISTIINFSILSITESAEKHFAFTLQNKNPIQYIVLVLVGLIPLFILYALVLCVRAKFLKRKWLWIIFIIIGIGQVRVNWLTGQYLIKILAFPLLGSSFSREVFGPWELSVGLPLGAILFLIKRKKIKRAENTPTSS